MRVIQGRRPVVDFADVYVRSVQDFLREQGLSRGAEEASDSRDGKKRAPVKSRNRV
jgi:hypothetical protein